MSQLRALGAGLLFAAALLACSSTPETFPGSGPGGKPMRTATETAVGLPPAASPRLYPLNAHEPFSKIDLGATGPDAYRWLENTDSAEVGQWLKAQNSLSQPRLAALPARAWFRARLGQLWNYERYGVPVKRGEHYFYLHRDAGRTESALRVSDAAASAGRVLVDPLRLNEGAAAKLTDFMPDMRGGVLAYAVADGAWQRWRFRRTADGLDLPDTLRATPGTSLSWARDDSGVYYTRRPALADGTPDEAGRSAVWFHKLGTSADADVIAYQVSAHVTHLPSAQVSEDGHYLVVTLLEAAGRNGIDLLDLTQPAARPTHLLAPGEAHVGYLGVHASELYFVTTQQAPLGRLIAVDPREPGRRRVVVPEGGGVLEQATYVGDSFVLSYVEDAHSVVRVFERDGRPRGEVALPGLGSVADFAGEATDAQVFFSYTDYLTPATVLRLDLSSLHASVWQAMPQTAPGDFVTEQVHYTSQDGTRIPLYVTHRRDVPRDGDQPLLLYATAGRSMTPRYRPQVQAWLQMGGLYAEADLHAGDFDLGDTRAVLENEQLALDDLVAAAGYLAGQHYTRSARLGIYGRGGAAALVAMALVTRPELFGAALPAAGSADPARGSAPAGAVRAWRAGLLPDDEAQQLRTLYGYPSSQTVKRNCYPASLVSTADRDAVIPPWHSYKLAAALQASQSCGNPILLRAQPPPTSAAGASVEQQLDELAEQWTFIGNWLGLSPPPAAAAPQ